MALACLLVLAAYSVFFFGVPAAQPGDTGADRAANVLDGRAMLELAGWLGLFGGLLLATGAFFLASRPLDTGSQFPASSFWFFVALGSLVILGVNANLSIGMATLARGYADDPGAFNSAQDTVEVLLGTALLAQVIGFLAIFWGERGAANAAIPAWLCYVGMASAVFLIPHAVGLMAGYEEMRWFGLATYPLFLTLLALSVRLVAPQVAAAGVEERRGLRA